MEKEDYGKCLFCGTAIPKKGSPRNSNAVSFVGKRRSKEAGGVFAFAETEQSRLCFDDRAEKERMETLKRAAEEIEQLFGESAADFGFGPATPRVTDVLKELSVLAYDGEIGSGKIDIPGDSKAAIGINAKGVITVMRTKTTAAKREV